MIGAANDPRDSRLVRLEAALAHAGHAYTVPDLVDAVREGRAQIWEEGDTLAVTEIVTYPRARSMRIWLCAGELYTARTLLPRLEQWALELGCTRMEAEGRRGWAIEAAAHGYAAVATVFRKDLRA